MNKRRCNVYFSCKKRHTLVKKQLMVNNLGIIIHKTDYKKKEEDMTIYSIYKKNHPVTTKQILNVFDLGYLGVEKDFPKQLSSIPIRRERNLELFSKRIATKIILKKENNNRAYYLQIEKVQYSCRHI
jgi:hypothetical protein